MEKRKVRVGVLGAGRGTSMMQYCYKADNAELVAICDRDQGKLDHMKELFPGEHITYYTNYEEMLKHDMDVVVLANFSTQHAPFAIKAMESGINVISELMPFQHMKEAVELIETVERTGRIYCYAENYCYMESPWEMKRLYQAGEIGTLEYAEGEYVHDREHIAAGTIDFERNPLYNWYANYYGSHAIGPIIHITGMRPVKVTGYELPFSSRNARMALKSGNAAVEMIEMENGTFFKAYHGQASATSIFYEVYGSKGRMESERVMVEGDYARRMYLESYAEEGRYDQLKIDYYYPQDELSEKAKGFGFSGADYRMMWHMMEKMLGNPKADTIDVYEAADMFLPCLFGYRSVLQGGIPLEIPNLRDPAEREKWRKDTACFEPEEAGDMLLPSYSKGEIVIEDSVYEHIKEQHRKGKHGLLDVGLPRRNIMLKMKEEGKLW